jgi:hypothetical protein
MAPTIRQVAPGPSRAIRAVEVAVDVADDSVGTGSVIMTLSCVGDRRIGGRAFRSMFFHMARRSYIRSSIEPKGTDLRNQHERPDITIPVGGDVTRGSA